MEIAGTDLALCCSGAELEAVDGIVKPLQVKRIVEDDGPPGATDGG